MKYRVKCTYYGDPHWYRKSGDQYYATLEKKDACIFSLKEAQAAIDNTSNPVFQNMELVPVLEEKYFMVKRKKRKIDMNKKLQV